MISQEQLDADKQSLESAVDAVNRAQETLNQAQAQLDKDNAEIEALKPHLSVLDEMETFALGLEDSASDTLKQLVQKARALF